MTEPLNVLLLEAGPSRPELHEPLGLELILAVLEKGLAPSRFTIIVKSLSYERGYLARFDPQEFEVIAIGAKIGTWARVQQVFDSLKQTNWAGLLLVGDLLGTYAYQEILAQYPPAVCIRGEAEDAIVSVIRNYADLPYPRFQESLSFTPNLAFSGEGGIVLTDRRAVNMAYSPQPSRVFARTAIERRSQVQVEGSRGCPWSRCSFCSIPELATSTWRPYPLKHVVDQITELSELGAFSIYFTDPDFLGGDAKRAIAFGEEIIRLKHARKIRREVNFYINLQVTGILGGGGVTADTCKDMLGTLKSAGLREVFVGIESGAKDQVRRYAKASTASRNVEALRFLANMRLQTDVGFIMFDPLMSLGELQSNLTFLKDCALTSHPSRFTKALRIQPETPYVMEFFGSDVTKLNVNNLSHPYRFRDPQVGLAYKLFREWECQHLNFSTLVQGASKGEVASEDTRLQLRSYLGKLRELDLGVLAKAVNAAGYGTTRPRGWCGTLESAEIEWKALFGCRPNEVDEHADSLGVSTEALQKGSDEASIWYQALNVYEDPVEAVGDSAT